MVFAALEPLVILITREELVAMAKVITGIPGSLILQVAQMPRSTPCNWIKYHIGKVASHELQASHLVVQDCVCRWREVEDGGAEEHGVYYLRPNDQRSRLKM